MRRATPLSPEDMDDAAGGRQETSSFLRSEVMSLVQLYIPLEIAHLCISEIGKLGMIEFRNVSRPLYDAPNHRSGTPGVVEHPRSLADKALLGVYQKARGHGKKSVYRMHPGTPCAAT